MSRAVELVEPRLRGLVRLLVGAVMVLAVVAGLSSLYGRPFVDGVFVLTLVTAIGWFVAKGERWSAQVPGGEDVSRHGSRDRSARLSLGGWEQYLSPKFVLLALTAGTVLGWILVLLALQVL